MGKHTPGPMLREDRTLYILEETGFRKGKPVLENRITCAVYGRLSVPTEEVDAIAEYLRVAYNSHEALVEALKEVVAVVEIDDLQSWVNAFYKARAALALAGEDV